MPVLSDDPVRVPSVVAGLYMRTKDLHARAERTGIVNDILRGKASRAGYALLLRNLQPAYQALECGLDHHRNTRGLASLAAFRFERANALAADLEAIIGPRWSKELPLLDEGNAYAKRISEVAKSDGSKLIAHAYTRYLGDLSGGLIMKKLLAKSLNLSANELQFYDFAAFPDLSQLKTGYRQALDCAGENVADHVAIVEEGATAFSFNISLSCAIKEVAGESAIAAE